MSVVVDAVADLVIRAGKVYSFGAGPVTAFAARGGNVVAVAGPDDAGDLLRAWVGSETVVIDDPQLVVLPAFVDTHNHLMLAARNVLGVPVSQATDIASLIALVRARAERTPPGDWVVSAADWHEMRLAERRMPTAQELDLATADHPVLVQRGGHNMVLNSEGLRRAGIGRDTPDVPGGVIVRDAAGDPAGWLQDNAMAAVMQVVPAYPVDALADGLVTAAARYAAHGLGTVRDPAISPDDWQVYRAAAPRLAVRSHPMIITAPGAIDTPDAYLDALEAQGITPGATHGRARLWGLKFVLDGGVEAAALSEPYLDRPDFYGELAWERDHLAIALETCLRRGWPVGAHAFGDRAVGLIVDLARELTERHGPIPPGLLVIEHGGLIGAERIAEATSLGIHITVQQALITGLGPALLNAWGTERTAALFPLRHLLDAGASISAGTDHPIGPLDPLANVYHMVTRASPSGILGPEHAITRIEALRLYTTAGAQFLGRRDEPLSVGAPADFVGYHTDPYTCPDEQLRHLAPAVTGIAGALTYRAE
ncbi:amidohydrolase [Nocardia sp. NPDC049149]|uniref:amidohydrolase n=1 Tax=Nocardia sp. NPDC049149 TaxID=3364315 RepID=UPI00371119DA